MAQTLGKPYVARKQIAIKADAKLLGAERIKEVVGDSSVFQVLEKMNPKQGVLLILDEAQRVSDFKNTPDKKIQLNLPPKNLEFGEFSDFFFTANV